MQDTNRVSAYYDRNSRSFLKFGHGAKTHAIHRAVWRPGTSDRDEAMHAVTDIVGTEARKRGMQWAVDVGCGVGGSVLRLAMHHGISGIGITNSPAQQSMAGSILSNAPSSIETAVLLGDYMDPTLFSDLGRLKRARPTIAYCIESFVHAPDANALLRNLALLLAPGDVLIVCDDFLAEPAGARRKKDRWVQRRLHEFRSGWRIGSLLDVQSAEDAAGEAGFRLEKDTDLTPFLDIYRPRDIAARPLLILPRLLRLRNPFWGNLLGGDALQRCLKHHIIEYRFLVFTRM